MFAAAGIQMISVRGADVSAWTQTGGDRQLNPLSVAAQHCALHMRLWNPSGQREQTANFPKRDPTQTTLQTVSGQHYRAAGADTAPSDGGQGSV
jgi:hypothetical protein